MFGKGFYGGLAVAIVIGLFLLWLWQPERQVKRHTENLFKAVERKNWEVVAQLTASNYEDRWGDDRDRMLGRLREVFRYFRDVRITSARETIQIDDRSGTWTGNIAIEAGPGELGGLLKERVNSLGTPFRLEWRRQSSKPWDWKLVRVDNPGLEIPAGAYE